MANGGIDVKFGDPNDALAAAIAATTNQTLPDVASQLGLFGAPSAAQALPDQAAPPPDQAAAAPVPPSPVLPSILGGTGDRPAGPLPPMAPPAGLYPGQGPLTAPPPPSGNLPAAELPGGGAASLGPALTGPLAGSQLPAGGTVSPAGAKPMDLPRPANIPPQTMGQKILGTLGKIGGTALGIVAPGVAAQIPGTPLGKIAQQMRGIKQEELQLGLAKTAADVQEAQQRTLTSGAEADKARAEAQKAQLEAKGWKYMEGTNMMLSPDGRTQEIQGLKRINVTDAQTPLTQAEIAQRNPGLETVWHEGHPGVPVPPHFQLQPGATQADYASMEAMLKTSVDQGLTQAQRDAANRMQEQNFALKQSTAAAAKSDREAAALERSYNSRHTELTKTATPIGDLAKRLGTLSDNLNLRTQQADSVIAPELLSVIAGGAGTGVRINDAEISRVLGGARIWDQLKSAASKFSTDPKAPMFDNNQRAQIRQIIDIARAKTMAKEALVTNADVALAGATDSQSHKQIMVDFNKRLRDIDNPPPEGWVWAIDGGEVGLRSSDGKQFQPFQ